MKANIDIDDAPYPAPSTAPWFGVLHGYEQNAGGDHDLAAMRASVAAGRRKKRAGRSD